MYHQEKIKHLKLALLLIGIYLLPSCKQNNYYNSKLQTKNLFINFYKPDSFQLIKSDTLYQFYTKDVVLKYQNPNDTSISIYIQFTVDQYRKFPSTISSCDLKCELKNRMFNLSGSIDTDSQYGYLIEINRQNYARVHYNIYSYRYVYDQIFTLHNDLYVKMVISSYNYNLRDTFKYSKLRDTLFNSVVLVKK